MAFYGSTQKSIFPAVLPDLASIMSPFSSNTPFPTSDNDDNVQCPTQERDSNFCEWAVGGWRGWPIDR